MKRIEKCLRTNKDKSNQGKQTKYKMKEKRDEKNSKKKEKNARWARPQTVQHNIEVSLTFDSLFFRSIGFYKQIKNEK